jgi:hypothetical protein
MKLISRSATPHVPTVLFIVSIEYGDNIVHAKPESSDTWLYLHGFTRRKANNILAGFISWNNSILMVLYDCSHELKG